MNNQTLLRVFTLCLSFTPQDTAYQTFTEWIDEEKVEEFNEFLDNQLQSKLGRGYNSAAAARAWWATSLASVVVLLLLYDNRTI